MICLPQGFHLSLGHCGYIIRLSLLSLCHRPSTNTSFCTESKECLEYELVCKTDEYEVRHYSPTRWVSTDAEAYFMGVGAAMAFRRLFQYITGANEGGIQMEMTAPVLVKIPEETKMWEPAVYTLNFPLPAAYQEKPPAPTNDKLYFTEMPEMDVYVRSYGGWMLSVTSRLHAHLLTKELERVRASYNHSYHYGVGYDSPLKLLNRHNEVWYVADGCSLFLFVSLFLCITPTPPYGT
uniref:Heme-binding protein 1 n=1 Tax=Dicentrarchus labrax TaxID=13489 RepID=A0A8C4NY61_DICLA